MLQSEESTMCTFVKRNKIEYFVDITCIVMLQPCERKVSEYGIKREVQVYGHDIIDETEAGKINKQ